MAVAIALLYQENCYRGVCYKSVPLYVVQHRTTDRFTVRINALRTRQSFSKTVSLHIIFYIGTCMSTLYKLSMPVHKLVVSYLSTYLGVLQ